MQKKSRYSFTLFIIIIDKFSYFMQLKRQLKTSKKHFIKSVETNLYTVFTNKLCTFLVIRCTNFSDDKHIKTFNH